MFSYSREQMVHELGGKKVGGLPGEHPTLMVGSIFYQGQFKDPRGSTDAAAELIVRQDELAEMVGLNSIADIFVYEEPEISWKVDFALDTIDGYFSLDIPDGNVRIKVLEYLDDHGGLDRCVYNSINLGISDRERRALAEHTPSAAILLGYNPQDTSAQGRLDMIRDGGVLLDEGLLKISHDAGIKYALLDTATTPFGEGASEALRAIPVFKSEFGLPVGCAMHNAVEAWLWLERYERRKEVMPTVDAAIDALPLILGADFVYYGPMENAHEEFITVAMVDRIVAEGAECYFGTEIHGRHPYHKV